MIPLDNILLIVGLGVVLGIAGVLLAIGKVPLNYNLRNLLVRWRVTLLTALAFTLVVSLLTVMLAFVNGMKRLTDASGQPGNVIVLSNVFLSSRTLPGQEYRFMASTASAAKRTTLPCFSVNIFRK